MRALLLILIFLCLLCWVGAEPVLRGVLVSERGRAVVIEEGGRQTLLWIGQSKDGMKLIKVGDGWALLNINGKELKLDLQYSIEEEKKEVPEKEKVKIEVIKVDPELIFAGHETMNKLLAAENVIQKGPLGDKIAKYIERMPLEGFVEKANSVLQTFKVQVVHDEGGGYRGIGITDVVPGSPVEGLKLASGDIIRSINGRPIRTIGDLIMVYNEYKRGLRRFVVEIERGGKIIRKEYRLE